MVITTKSATVIGLEVFEISVEVDTINSIPQVAIVGLPDTAISEAKERLRLAIKNSSFSSQRQQKSNVSRKYYSAKNNSLNSDVVSFKARPLQVLQNEYNKLIKAKGLNPVKAFFSISDEQSAMDGLLTSILKSEDSAFEFIADAVKNPRETLKFANA